MEYKYIANLIAMERHKHGLSVVDVCDGLCSSGVFRKIENGSLRGEIHLIIAILQRLGINGGKAGRYLCRQAVECSYDHLIKHFYTDLQHGKIDTSEQSLSCQGSLIVLFQLYFNLSIVLW